MSWLRRRLRSWGFGQPEAPRPIDKRILVLDVLAVLLLGALPLLAWAREGVAKAPGGPWFVLDSDQYLFGPDAAAWAQNALALHQGRLSDLDPHRLPTWTILTSAFMHLGGWDVALSGHLINRLELVLLGPVLYLLGRSTGLGALSFVAGAVAAIQPLLLASSCRFGVDPTVTFFVPLTLLTGRLAGKRWWFAPVAGAVAGLTMVSHLTTLAFPICGLLVLLASGKRLLPTLLGATLFALTTWWVFHATFSVFPMLPSEFFKDSLAEGIAPTGEDLSVAGRAAARTSALATLQQNAPEALDGALRFIVSAFRPPYMPWMFGVVLAWLGFVGPGAAEAVFGASAVVRGSTRLGRIGRSLAEGVALGSACAPLLAFAAAHSPERYSDNLLPVAAFMVVRGAATLLTALTELAARLGRFSEWRGHALLVLGVLVSGAWTLGEWQEPHQRAAVLAPDYERNALAVGKVLAQHFPPGIGAASCLREVLPYAGLRYCPNTVCPFSDDEAGYHHCVKVLREECPGTGDIPLVVTDGLTAEQRPERRAHFEAWVETRLTPVATAAGSRIYAIPREGEF